MRGRGPCLSEVRVSETAKDWAIIKAGLESKAAQYSIPRRTVEQTAVKVYTRLGAHIGTTQLMGGRTQSEEGGVRERTKFKVDGATMYALEAQGRGVRITTKRGRGFLRPNELARLDLRHAALTGTAPLDNALAAISSDARLKRWPLPRASSNSSMGAPPIDTAGATYGSFAFSHPTQLRFGTVLVPWSSSSNPASP